MKCRLRRVRFLVAYSVIVAAVPSSIGQTVSRPHSPKDEPPAAILNVVGGELKIGMTKAQVMSKFGSLTGYDIRPEINMAGDVYLLRIRKGDSDVAWINFEDGVVSSIHRNDHDYFAPETKEAFKDLWDALHFINEDDGLKDAKITTSVRTFTTSNPPQTLFDIWIAFANGKTVHLSWFLTSGANLEQQLYPKH